MEARLEGLRDRLGRWNIHAIVQSEFPERTGRTGREPVIARDSRAENFPRPMNTTLLRFSEPSKS